MGITTEVQTPPRWKHVTARILIVIGAVLAGLTLVVGHVNREVLDGPSFAHHVDEIRRDDAVARQLGTLISDQIILANPNLVALRPLVEQVSTQVAGSDVLDAPVRRATEKAHRAIVTGEGDLSLRIDDAAVAVNAVLARVAPDRAPLPTNSAVALVSVGDAGWAQTVQSVASKVGTLAWLLPVLAAACFAAAVLLSPRRWRAAGSVGRSLAIAAGAVGGLLVIGGFLVRRVDDDRLGGAVAQATWAELIRPMWWSVLFLAVVGLAVLFTCDSSAPATIAARSAQLRDAVLDRDAGPVVRVGRIVVAAALGLALLADPLGLVELVMTVGGIGLVLYAVVQVGTVAARSRPEEPIAAAAGGPERDAPPARHRGVRLAALGLAVAVVVGAVVLMARPGDDVAVVEAGEVETCNGHVELCERRFDEVAYVASHNSMSVANLPGWFLAEQIDPIPTQLDEGVRALLIDVWRGRSAGTIVRTDLSSYAAALEVTRTDLGPEAVALAARLGDSVAGMPEGPEMLYMCHGLCETGSTPFGETMQQLRAWLAVNPGEVVTLFIEDHVDSPSIAADIEAAGLLPYIHTPVPGAEWPTLREMIDSDQRLVVMVEEGGGGAAAPWLVNGFEYTQDTPYTFPTVDDFSCAENRGPGDAPLFLLNHWLSGFTALVSSAQLVNASDVLLTRATECEEERGQIPNFVAVNYVAIGDVYDVVDELNGVASLPADDVAGAAEAVTVDDTDADEMAPPFPSLPDTSLGAESVPATVGTSEP